MELFAALSDSTRVKILEKLATEGALSVAKIREPFDMTAPAISQHLKALLDAKLVVVEKKAQSRIYSLNYERLTDLSNWTTRLQAGLKPNQDLAGKRRKRGVTKAVSSLPLIASENGALQSFLGRRSQKN